MIEQFSMRKVEAVQRRVNKLTEALFALELTASLLHASKKWVGAPKPHPDEADLTRRLRRNLRKTRNANRALMQVVRDPAGRVSARRSGPRLPRSGRVVAKNPRRSRSTCHGKRTTA